uniref:Germ cell nuclear acidic peptidase n=1 Tax=Amphilophus citrinellus TaxID=61819 RepID=A0A3Q0RIB8_AMPCI
MNDATSKSFHIVAKKMGWMDEGGLEAAEKKLIFVSLSGFFFFFFFLVPKKTNTPAAQHPIRRPLSLFNSPVFVSDNDDDDIVVRSTWRTRHTKPKSLPKTENNPPLCDKEETKPLVISPKRTFSAPSKLNDSSSSEEEFTSLLERLKKKNNFIGTSFLPKNNKEPRPGPTSRCVSCGDMNDGYFICILDTEPFSFLYGYLSSFCSVHFHSRTVLCKTPGCFLQSLTNPSSSYADSFKRNKEELTSKLYQLYNTTVFGSKLPVNMSVSWNKKMRKTAGYCVTGQEKGGGNRYARIELSEKVCDSADRLRDTLIHEMCHAATWLINGVRDGHGNFWKLYARKATLAHPELPMVTRCHSYDIKYKFQYQCTRCQNTIGRHSKSLDTQRFVCALCTGQLVLLTPSKPRAPTPFANFVKENYGSVRQKLAGQSHAEVMRKLSADFASKTKLSQS